jgi:hypothetical protein
VPLRDVAQLMLATTKPEVAACGCGHVRRARRSGYVRWGFDGGKVGVPVEPPAGGVLPLALGVSRIRTGCQNGPLVVRCQQLILRLKQG